MSQIILDSANDLIQGDFDNATLSQRTRLQTSTVNATTGVYVVPNGTANSASVQISNAADPTNASKLVVATNGSTDTQIVSGANGSGTYLPLSIYTNNDIRLQVNNSGALGVRTGPGTVGFGTSGQFLTSNGSGAGVSWTTVTVPPSGQLQTQLFTSPGTWTNPGSVTSVRVTVVGGGGGGGNHPSTPSAAPAGNGGNGGYAKVIVPVSAPVAIAVGSGGGGTASGGTSSFGPAVSATGGAAGGPGSPGAAGAPGSGTVSVGTNLRSSSVLDIDGTRRSFTDPFIYGNANPSAAPSASVAFSASGSFGAGLGGFGGGAGPAFPGKGGVGGAVIVEWVG